ncbi:MAG: hypothetical protein ACI8SE_000030 [Bacteroidia bacterium]|jgi:hypothetical protein
MQTSILRKIGLLVVVLAASLNYSLAQTFKISPNGNVNLCSGQTLTIEATSGFSKYKWSTTETTQVIKVTATGTYYCLAADRSGKTYSDTVHVTVVKAVQPKLSITPSNKTVCLGDSLAIDVINKFKAYEWSDRSTKPYLVIYPKTSGYVTLLVTDSNGCKADAKIQYTVKSCSATSGCDSLIGAWPDSVICSAKDSAILEAKSGFTSYLWDNGSTSKIRTIRSAGTYTLKAKDSSGNVCYDTIVISGGSGRLSITAKTKEICKGDSVELAAYEGFTKYVWNTGSKDRKITVKPTTTTGYLVTATDSAGCEYKEDIKITVKSCDDCDDLLGSSKKVLCGDKDSVVIEGKSGFKTYKWSTGSNDRVIKVKKKGWYVLTATTQRGKECKDSIYIGQGGKTLKAYSNPNPAVVCPGDKVVIEVTGGFKTYWWNTGHRYDRAELYLKESKTVVIEATDSNGCSARVEVKIIVKDTCNKGKCPRIIEYWPKKTLCGTNDSISLEAKSGYKDYTWSTRETGRAIWVKKKGWYYLDFKDSSGNWCQDSIYIGSGSSQSLKIEVTPGKPYCIGDTVYAKATKGFKTYGWNTGSKDRIIEIVLAGRIKLVVEAVDSNGCEARADFVLEPDSCNSSIDIISLIDLKISPNPIQSALFINASTPIITAEVLAIDGKRMLHIYVFRSSLTLNMTEIPSGLYLLKIETSVGTVFQRVVKE